jgi:predicted nucleic acid-binding protein
MNAAILVDADVLVDYFRGYPQAVSLVKEQTDRIILSAITVGELYAGVRGQDEREMVDDFVLLHPVVPLTTEIAKDAGLLRRDYGRSHGVGLMDAIVAATAQAENADLWTLNLKHFPMFPDLKRAYTK